MGVYNKDALFTAILSNDTDQIKRLKSQSAELCDNVKNMLSIRRFDLYNIDADRHEIDCDFQCAVRTMNAEDFIRTIRTLREEIGETLFFFPAMWTDIKKIMFEDGVWECVLDCFDHKMNKMQTMRKIIDANRPDILEVCARHGWLSQAKKRDAMIQYATDSNKTEITAWLLDFKNKNFDLAAEREKADKKAERELNAAPDSVTALKQIWCFKKQGDGSLIITGYKGHQTEVVVPEKIGKDTVTAIGNAAFCPFARRVSLEIKQARERITKITLPETIRIIGEEAFWACRDLVSVNIPDGVKIINENTFAECLKLEKIVIPNSVKCIERRAFFVCKSLRFVEVPEGVELINEAAFSMCKELTTLVLPGSLKYISTNILGILGGKFVGAVVPRGSIAEEYCKKHNIPFSDKLVEVEPGSPAEEYCRAHDKPYIYKEDNPL